MLCAALHSWQCCLTNMLMFFLLQHEWKAWGFRFKGVATAPSVTQNAMRPNVTEATLPGLPRFDERNYSSDEENSNLNSNPALRNQWTSLSILLLHLNHCPQSTFPVLVPGYTVLCS
jgi:hypothetical protein